MSPKHAIQQFMAISAAIWLLTACGIQPVMTMMDRNSNQIATFSSDTTQTPEFRSISQLFDLIQNDRPDLLDGLNLSADQNQALNGILAPRSIGAVTEPSVLTSESSHLEQQTFEQTLRAAFVADNFEPATIHYPLQATTRIEILSSQLLALHHILSPTQRTQFLRNVTQPDPSALQIQVFLPQSNRFDQVSSQLSLDMDQKSQLENILQSDVAHHQQVQTQNRSQLLLTLSAIMAESSVNLTQISNWLKPAEITPAINRLSELKAIHNLLSPAQRELWVEINGNSFIRTGFGFM